MHINEQFVNLEKLSQETHQYIGRDKKTYIETEDILIEHMMDIYVNEHLTMKLICIPEYLTELVIGRLLTEGIIADVEEIESIYICEYGKRARVILKNDTSHPTEGFVETTPSCCTGNHILNDYFIVHREVFPVKQIIWKAEWIFKLADRFSSGMPIHSRTFATHSCFLAMEDRLLFECEDIGRHNALDKAIGYALRNQIDLTKCMLYSSGRIPTDMVMKAIRAGIPVLASKASLTREAIQLASEYQLTLIGAARQDRMKLYTGNSPSH